MTDEQHIGITVAEEETRVLIDGTFDIDGLAEIHRSIREAITEVKRQAVTRRREAITFDCDECGWSGDLTETDTRQVGSPESDRELMARDDIPTGAKAHLWSTRFVACCPECGA